MRYKVDNTALEDMYTFFDEAEIEPTTLTESNTEEILKIAFQSDDSDILSLTYLIGGGKIKNMPS